MDNFTLTTQYIKQKMQEFHLPYIKCVVTLKNKIVFEYRFSTLGENDLLKMYSMSKPITVAAFMQLVEKGLVSTDDLVSKYIKGFDELFIKKTGKKAKYPLRIHHLLTMTSGLDYDFNRLALKNYLVINPKASTVELSALFFKDGLLFEPGTSFNYSTSIDVIAAIIEIVSGLKFSQYVEENIFKPLGMEHSSFKNKLGDTSNCIKEYVNQNDQWVEADEYYKYFLPTKNYESGGAGLISTVDDYSIFINSLACDEKILKESSIKMMSTIYVESTPFDSSINEYSKDNKDYGYGYGVRVRKRPSLSGIPEHEFGWDGATGSYCLCDRKNHVSITLGLNIQMWPSYLKDFHIQLIENIYRDIFKKL